MRNNLRARRWRLTVISTVILVLNGIEAASGAIEFVNHAIRGSVA